ncbi:MAG: glycosyltransferase family 2 protein [Rhodospirillales bacterium]|nr:glycosyltransferase family 2 protein [Rhodospirillales bacterium]
MTGKTRGVAFVVTVFNKECYLEATLKSILAQEGDFDREIIVVDDGSTDRSREIAESLIGGLANGKLIEQVNSGPGVAQNTGVAAASMPVIKFVDGDDLLPPDCVLRMLPGLDLPNVMIVHGDGRVLNKSYDAICVDRKGKPPAFEVMDKPLYYSIRHSLAGATSLLVVRAAYLECGGCDATVFTQENSLVYRMAVKYAFAFTQDVILFAPPRDFRTEHGGHLGDDMVQMEHDRNAALYGLLRDFPDLPHGIKRLALKRAAGRAWKWARRVNKKTLGCDRIFWINLIAYLPWLPAYEKLLHLTMRPYRESEKVRIPPRPVGGQDFPYVSGIL